jgi:hypothetical protein
LAAEEPTANLKPRLVVWPAGRPIVRAHPSIFGSTEFDRRPDGDSRFSTIRPNGIVQGVLYGAEDQDAAASETIFHTVPADRPGSPDPRPRQIPLGPYESWMWSTVACGHDLVLVELDSDGLEAIGTNRELLILSGRRDYPRTRRWSEALWHAAPQADGLYWVSRQSVGKVAVMLFETRDDRPGGVARHELFADGAPDPFFYPARLARLADLASRLNITLVF